MLLAGLVDDGKLQEFGVGEAGHREEILAKLKGMGVGASSGSGSGGGGSGERTAAAVPADDAQQAHVFKVGDVVKARPADGGSLWFEGHISELGEGGDSAEVEFDDSSKEVVAVANIKRVLPWNALEVGDHVKVRYQGGVTRFEAVVTRVCDEPGHYDVQYDDGETEERVREDLIEKLCSYRSHGAELWAKLKNVTKAVSVMRRMSSAFMVDPDDNDDDKDKATAPTA
eukprot:g2153.t1